MKKMWKNVLGIVLVAAISAGAAVGTSAYLINKNQPVFGTSGSANTFNQPIRLAGYCREYGFYYGCRKYGSWRCAY